MKKVMDGNEACAHTSYMFTEVAGIYPITPASQMAEYIDEWSSRGRKNLFGSKVKVVEMQSEGGAAGMIHGALQAGTLASTYTASQGLLLMIPNMYKMAGELLPGVIHVASRTLATHALSIFGDHSDIYSTRASGFVMLASSSVQQVMDMSAIAHLSSIESSLPFLHFFDGFRTSHELNKIEVLEEKQVEGLLNKEKVNEFRNNALVNSKLTRGTAQNDDVYFQAAEVRNNYYTNVIETVEKYMNLLGQNTGRKYKPFEYYGSANAKNIIIAMGSVCETIKETIDNTDEEVGLVEVHLYRPFSKEQLLEVIPSTAEKIAVLDRTKEPGSSGEPLYLDINNAYNGIENKPLIIGGRYGLSSKNVGADSIKSIYDFLNSENVFNGFTVGINDDVTNKSIPMDKEFHLNKPNDFEFMVYGYGSDGMTSTCKSIIRIIGDNTDKYVQGYFQYDSRKSGGVTRAHLRMSDNIIRSTHYVTNPTIVVCSKDLYLSKYDMFNGIKENGIVLINTEKTGEEINSMLSNDVKKMLIDKKVKFYIANANKIARDVGLGHKINTVMQSCVFRLINVMDYEEIKMHMKEQVKKRYFKKGEKVIEANYKAIDSADDILEEITLTANNIEELKIDDDSVINKINKLKGDDVPVSAFLEYPDGSFEGGNTKYEKRGVSDFVPKFISENCIQCGMCSMVCPHAVVRPFLLDGEEELKVPDHIKKNMVKAIGKDLNPYKFVIGVSKEDCTGCELCTNICPGKNGEKALVMERKENVEDDAYLFENVTEKKIDNPFTIKTSQFKKPLFEFSGACAGCGETPYIKLLTQLFGDRLVIANATGCSSIYGGSVPSTPYSVSWANSLFEDNAEYGYGLLTGINTMKSKIKDIMENSIDSVEEHNKELFTKWLENNNNYLVTKEIKENINYEDVPNELKELKDYIVNKSIWTIGGDGWAYDIGYGGLDHVLASNDNVNILVLDTQVYSNTGGQSSKASRMGSIAKFTADGKKTNKKDLGRIAMSYQNCYVASVSLGANMMSVINVFKEAESYDGPSIIIAYSPCIAHGIDGGMSNSINREKLAVEAGYVITYKRSPETGFKLLSTEPDFTKYEEFLEGEKRYSMLKVINPDKAKEMFDGQKQESMNRWEYYKNQVN